MEDLLQARRRVHEEFQKMGNLQEPKVDNTPDGLPGTGFNLGYWMIWFQDWILEECLILKEEMMTETVKLLYNEARERAVHRQVSANQLIPEAEAGFATGLRWAIAGHAHVGEEEKYIKSRIHTEDNFAFGFVCGVLARLEAVKGKAYQASWQKRGEVDGAMVQVERKFDRLDATTRHDATGETKSQVLGDLSVYSIKWLTYRAELDPEEFVKWIMEVKAL